MTDETTNTEVTEKLEEVVQESEQKETVEESQEDKQDKNWREVREKMSELKRQNEEMAKALYQQQMQTQYQQQNQLEETQEEDDEDLLTKKSAKKIAKKLAEEAVQKYIKESEVRDIPAKLRSRYNDYDRVVCKETVDRLVIEDPEAAEALAALVNEPYKQGVMAYKLLKSHMGEEMPKKPKDKSKTPLSSSAVSKSTALSNAHNFANGLTQDLKDQLWKEMQESAKYR